MATQHLFYKFHKFSIPQNSNSIAALHALEDMNNQMKEKGMVRIPDTVLHARFVHALPAEYDHAKETLQPMKTRDRNEVIRVVNTRYSNLPQKKGVERSSRPPEHVFFSSELEAGAAHDGVAVAIAGAAGAAAVAGIAVVEVATTSPVVLVVIQVDSKKEVEATTAPVAVGVAAAKEVVIRPPAAVGVAGGGATGKRSAPRRRAITCPGALGAQVLAARRAPAHQTRLYW